MTALFDIYAASADEKFRYLLGQRGSRMLFVLGLNPSTATAMKPDTTISKVRGVAQRNGFDGFLMLNLYPERATKVVALPAAADGAAMTRNIEMIAGELAAETSPTIWAAWGGDIGRRSYFGLAAAALAKKPEFGHVNWVRFGDLTSDGHPRHPSRLSYIWTFHPFDAKAYCREIIQLER